MNRTQRIMSMVLFLFTILAMGVVIKKADAAPPAAPAIPQAKKAGPVAAPASCPTGVLHCANLSWTASVADASHGAATGYNVYRSTTNGGCGTVTATTCQKVNSSSVAGTTYTDSPLAAATNYFYVVTGFNAAGESGPSNQLPLTTNTDPTPNAPTGLTGVAQ